MVDRWRSEPYFLVDLSAARAMREQHRLSKDDETVNTQKGGKK